MIDLKIHSISFITKKTEGLLRIKILHPKYHKRKSRSIHVKIDRHESNTSLMQSLILHTIKLIIGHSYVQHTLG